MCPTLSLFKPINPESIRGAPQVGIANLLGTICANRKKQNHCPFNENNITNSALGELHNAKIDRLVWQFFRGFAVVVAKRTLWRCFETVGQIFQQLADVQAIMREFSKGSTSGRGKNVFKYAALDNMCFSANLNANSIELNYQLPLVGGEFFSFRHKFIVCDTNYDPIPSTCHDK